MVSVSIIQRLNLPEQSSLSCKGTAAHIGKGKIDGTHKQRHSLHSPN